MSELRDPVADVARAMNRDRHWVVGAVTAAASMHAGIGSALARGRARTANMPAETPTQLIEIEPAVSTPSTEPVRLPERTTEPKIRERIQSRAGTQRAAAAQAAAVLARIDVANSPLDLTRDTVVVGSGAEYAGGASAAKGVSEHAFAATPTQTPGAPNARAGAVSERDLSRRASTIGGEWKCPFPSEADVDHIDNAAATLRVDVDKAGRAVRIANVDDPGHGFGRAAQHCAAGKRWSPALGQTGAPIAGTVTIRVHFDR